MTQAESRERFDSSAGEQTDITCFETAHGGRAQGLDLDP